MLPQGEPGEDTKQFLVTPAILTALCPKKHRVLQISCGMKHTAIIINSSTTSAANPNELLCFGGNQYGQCGNGEHGASAGSSVATKGPKVKSTYEVVEGALKGKSVTMVECGGAHTIVRTSNNDIYSFGLNDKGQLGLGTVGTFSSTPKKLKHFTSFQITQISCSEESSSVVTSNGDLFVWGRNTEGMFDSEAGIFALD